MTNSQSANAVALGRELSVCFLMAKPKSCRSHCGRFNQWKNEVDEAPLSDNDALPRTDRPSLERLDPSLQTAAS